MSESVTLPPSSEYAVEHLKREIAFMEDVAWGLAGCGDEYALLQAPMFMTQIEFAQKTLQHVEEGIPFTQLWYPGVPEFCTAMDLHWDGFTRVTLSGPLAYLVPEYLLKMLEESDMTGLPGDVCTLRRFETAAMLAGKFPRPTSAVACLHPCDGVSVFQSACEQMFPDTPMFWADSPYDSNERGITYYAGELRRQVEFLEKHHNKKLDWDRLREVIAVTDTQYELWKEFDLLKRNTPCPMGSWSGYPIHHMLQNCAVTNAAPVTTEYLKSLIAYAEKQVAEGKGRLENEKHRCLFMDIAPTWVGSITKILEEECNAVVVVDGMGDSRPYTPIDLTSEQTILEGLAKRYCMDTPMIRVSHGTLDAMLDDLRANVVDYNLDVVIAPGHIGHKDVQAAQGILRDTCREMGVKLLEFNYDLFDPRYTPEEEMRKILTQFFDAI